MDWIRCSKPYTEYLLDLSSTLLACQSEEEACEAIARCVRKILPTASGTLGVLSNSKNSVYSIFKFGSNPSGIELFDPHDCWALRTGHMNLTSRSGKNCQHSDSNFCLCFPLIAHCEVVGVLRLESNSDFPDNHLNFLQNLSQFAALSLGAIAKHKTLSDQSLRDSLTNLFNRRYLEIALEREIARSDRSQQITGLLMLDVDNFKKFNDTHGHQAGDFVLNQIGAVLRQTFRSTDVPCRYGGEELAVILSDTQVEGSVARANQVRARIETMRLEYQGDNLGTVTASIGVACYPNHATDKEDLIRRADEALYQAKRTGKNCVKLVSLNRACSQPLTVIDRPTKISEASRDD